MRNLENLIADWRKLMLRSVGRERIAELENHLRESIEARVQIGLSKEEAFNQAVDKIGWPWDLATEFRKSQPPLWLPLKAAIAIGALAAIALGIAFGMRFTDKPDRLLLAFHVYTLTFGYIATFLIGAMGICFVSQRLAADISPARLQSLARPLFIFSIVAVAFTNVGLIAGLLWMKMEWGSHIFDLIQRSSQIEAREVWTIAIVFWLGVFGAVQRIATVRITFLLSLLGNMLASIAWFAPVAPGWNRYDHSSYSTLSILIGVHCFFLLLGLLPSKFWAPQKTRSA